jgi:hypothetical protein
MTYGNNEITIPIRVDSSGRYLVLIQAYVDSASIFKGLSISVAGDLPIEVKPSNVVEGRYAWLPVGYYNLSPGDTFIKLRSLGGVAAVSKVATLPEEKVKLAEREIPSFLERSGKELIFVFDDYTWTFSSDPLKSIRKIFGASNGIIVDLGTSKPQAIFYVPKDGYYKAMARVLSSDALSYVHIFVDEDRLIALHASERGFSSVESGSFYLTRGKHVISLSGEGFIDFLMVFSADMDMPIMGESEITNRDSLSYEAYSSSRYMVTFNGKGLIFLETYSPNWLLGGNGRMYTSQPAYGFANIYLVENKSLTCYTLYYVGGEIFQIGLLLSIIFSFVFGLAIFAISKYNYRGG